MNNPLQECLYCLNSYGLSLHLFVSCQRNNADNSLITLRPCYSTCIVTIIHLNSFSEHMYSRTQTSKTLICSTIIGLPSPDMLLKTLNTVPFSKRFNIYFKSMKSVKNETCDKLSIEKFTKFNSYSSTNRIY